jgi:hypothetical protein
MAENGRSFRNPPWEQDNERSNSRIDCRHHRCCGNLHCGAVSTRAGDDRYEASRNEASRNKAGCNEGSCKGKDNGSGEKVGESRSDRYVL